MDLPQIVQYFLWMVYLFFLNTGCSGAEFSGHCPGFLVENLTFNCSHASMTSVPKDVPDQTKHLLLSHNLITDVFNVELHHLTRLILLDLSYNNISDLHVDTFLGLKSLQHLDLSYNSLYYPEFPAGLLEDQIESLRILMLTTDKTVQSGYPIEVLAKLTHLEELHINGAELSMFPKELAKLPLRVLNMQCPGQQLGPRILTPQWLEHLQNSTVEDISFYNCKIFQIHKDTFKDFAKLSALNLGENTFSKSFFNFSEPLFNLGLTPLRILILDHALKDIITGLSPEFLCNDVGDRITHLSIQYNNLRMDDMNMFQCMLNLTYLSIGFNTIPSNAYYYSSPFSSLSPLLQVVDISHCELNPGDYQNYFNASKILPMDSFFRNFELDIKKEWRDDERSYNFTPPHIIGRGAVYHIPDNVRALYARNAMPGPPVGWLNRYVTISQPNSLELLDYSFVRGRSALFGLFGFYGLNKVMVIDMSYSSVGPPKDSFSFDWMMENPRPEYPNLRELRAPGNYLDGYMHHFEALFNNTPMLESLDLSHNGIQLIPTDTFGPLRRLKTLNIANNALSLDSNLTLFNVSLRHLDISGNAFPYLPLPIIQSLEAINTLDAMNTLTVNIHENPYVCDCSSLAFINWVQTSEVSIMDRAHIKCKMAGQSGSIPLLKVSFQKLKRQCSPPDEKDKLIIANVVSIGLLTALGIVMYLQRWRMQWCYYRYRHVCFSSGSDDADLDVHTQYDALVIYSEKGTDDLALVSHHLRPTLEDDMGYRLFFNGRDDIPGRAKADEIIRAITQSRKALVLVTSDFVQDSWCNFALHMLIENGEIVEKVCLIVDRAVDIGRMRNTVLKRLLNPSSGISQVEYDENTWEGDIHYLKVLKEKLKMFLTGDNTTGCKL